MTRDLPSIRLPWSDSTKKNFFVDIMNRHFDSQLKITGSPSSASGTAIPSTLLQIVSKKMVTQLISFLKI